MRPSTSQSIAIRGLSYHVRSWGSPSAPKLFMLHGWMDVGASFQFLVDALKRDWFVIAPDWRGFGRSEWCAGRLLVRRLPGRPRSAARPFLARRAGSASSATVWAATSPASSRAYGRREFHTRFRSMASASRPRVRKSRRTRSPNGSMGCVIHRRLRRIASIAAVADRLQKNNPRLPATRRDYLAAHWAEVLPDGSARLMSDPRHKLPFPHVYRMEEVLAI